MPTFAYTAVHTTGKRVTGVLAGSNEQAVLAELESRQLMPVSIETKDERRGRRSGISARVLGTSYRQLSDLLRAGVPLLRALRLLSGRKSKPRLAAVFKQLADAVAEGEELATAMARSPRVFTTIHVAMVRAGEKGGFLEPVLTRLGQLVIGQAELRSKIVGSLVYPAALIVIGVSILCVVFGVFVPKFREMFEKVEGGLPASTQVVFALSDAVRVYGPFTALAIAGLAVGVWYFSRKPGVHRAIDEARTKAPVIGPLTRAMATARFCSMLMGTMLGNGVPVLSSMQIAKEAAGNSLMREAIERAAEAVKAGQSLAGPLGESGLFDDDVVEMITVGESANNLDEVLVTIAETIESRVDRLLTTTVRLIEPLMIVVLAGIVVFVAASLILPMMRMRAGM